MANVFKMVCHKAIVGLICLSMIAMLPAEGSAIGVRNLPDWTKLNQSTGQMEQFRLRRLDKKQFLTITPRNGIMISKELSDPVDLDDEYYSQATKFCLCNETNSCSPSSEQCQFKAELCVVNEDGSQSKIHYDTIHKVVARKDEELHGSSIYNNALVPSVHAVWEGGEHGAATKRSEYVFLEYTERRREKDEKFRLHFDMIEEASYERINWMNPTQPNSIEHRFKICKKGKSC